MPAAPALLDLLSALRARGYRFVTPTPSTHRRVLARKDPTARDLRDIFGWSLPFDPAAQEPDLVRLMHEGGVLDDMGELARSRVRVSSLGERLFLHSAFPPEEEDAVFFGPDTYRFADFIAAELPRDGGGLLVDVGTGAGVGGIVAAGLRPGVRVLLTDVNSKALALACVNAEHAGVAVETLETKGLDGVGEADVIVANPPYMVPSDGRTYREGGGRHGAELSLEWTQAAAERLRPGGRLLMYTGSAIVDGHDAFCQAATRALEAAGCDWRYRELDPDVFGGELSRPEYADVERIAVVGLVAVKRG